MKFPAYNSPFYYCLFCFQKFVCICTAMSAYLLICIYALVCVCVYVCGLGAGAEVDIHVFFKPCTDYSFETESLTELGALQLALAGQWVSSSCVLLFRAGSRGTFHHAVHFIWVLGIKFGSLNVHNKPLPTSNPSSPPFLFPVRKQRESNWLAVIITLSAFYQFQFKMNKIPNPSNIQTLLSATKHTPDRKQYN